MVMTDNKTFIMSFILFCLCGCTNEATKNVHGKFLCVTDSKPYSDYLFTDWLKEGNAINPREIELQYVIHNYTVEKLYLPIQTWSDSTTHSSINVFFINKKDTIYPIYSIKKFPYNSNYICKGDSLIVFVKIYNFEKWSKKEINVSTNLDVLIDKLHIEYHKSQKDVKKDYEIPNIKFGNSPQFYYEIPQDKSILKKEHRDRILVRVGQRK